MPNEPIHIGQSKEAIYLLPKMANRHGLIAGATGTGKTVTLQTLAENFSARGVPVFMADSAAQSGRCYYRRAAQADYKFFGHFRSLRKRGRS